MSRNRFGAWSTAWFAAAGLLLICAGAAAEIIHFKNGDTLHGTVVDANVRRVTLETAYGKLTIPKKDIQRIEYEGGEPEDTTEKTSPTSASKPAETKSEADLPIVGTSGSTVSLDIRGRAFWYAFESPPDSPTDLSIRLRISSAKTMRSPYSIRSRIPSTPIPTTIPLLFLRQTPRW